MSRQDKTKSKFLESWFQKGGKRGGTAPRPGSQNLTRPTSESDFGDVDDNAIIAYEQSLDSLSEKEINQKFELLLNDMNLNEDKKKPLRLTPLDNKKKMLVMHYRGVNQESKSKFDKPQQYIDYLNRYLHPDFMSSNKILACVESLRVALTNNTLPWVNEFGTPGMEMIYKVLDQATTNHFNDKSEKIQYECLRCILKFTNNTEGIKSFLKHEPFHELVAKCVDYRKPNVSICAIQILAALCFLNDGKSSTQGPEKALSAITKMSEERKCDRFKPITDCISFSDNIELWGICLQLINSILSQTDDFEFRMHLRNEIVRTGLHDNLDKLEKNPSAMVQTQYKVFANEKEEDADELHSRFENVRIDMDDLHECFEVLKNITLDTPAEPYFLSILQHLLFIRDDYYIRPAYYKIIEECVSQIVLQKSGLDPDFRKKHIDLDLQPLLEELAKDRNETEKDKNEDLKKQLDKALSEKEEALAKLAIMEGRAGGAINSGKLDPAMVNNIDKVLNNAPPPPPIPGMGSGPPPPPPPPIPGGPPPPPMPGMGPPPPPMPGSVGPPPPPMPGAGFPPPPPMPGMGPPPPPMPGMGGGGPPPPPPFGAPPPPMPGMVPLPGMVQSNVLPFGLKPKKKWEVSGPLKKANWKSIVPQKMSEKSFWVKVQEEKLASDGILEGLAERFSSKPVTKKIVDTVDKNNHVGGTMKKSKELKVLDGKSAQSISILLGGSLKHLAYDDIKKCLLRCDETILTENVLEQLIQHLPPPDQLSKLQQYKESYSDLTEAEQFCVKISEVKRLLPRLKSLRFKQQYAEMVNDVQPDIVAATLACEEVQTSKKFAKILELILLLGNYMNSGSRNAQAFGFEISFLTKLNGTKDVYNKSTLMHYIVETAEKNFPDILNFYDELSHIDRASRVSLDQIQKTLKQMDSSIKNLQTDITNNRVSQNEDDRFIEVMEQFSNEARDKCDVMQKMLKKVESLYSDLSEFYVFDKQKYTLEEFFTDLKTFKDNFIEAKKDNEREREIEEKNRKAKLAKEQAEKEKQARDARKRAIIDMNPEQTQEGVMDSLLEALQTGSAFNREQKRKRGARPAGAERRAQLVRSRSRTNVIAGRELRGEIAA